MYSRKNILYFLLFLMVLIGVGISYLFFKPHRDIRSEKALTTTAAELFNVYTRDERMANTIYLDRAIEVTGEIAEVKTNQDGKTVLVLKTEDPIFGIVCTLKENTKLLKAGEQVQVRGFCSGYTSDVVLRDSEVMEP